MSSFALQDLLTVLLLLLPYIFMSNFTIFVSILLTNSQYYYAYSVFNRIHKYDEKITAIQN